MIFALMDYQGGFDSFVGLALFQPILAVILSSLTVLICLILGLPIRLIRKLNQWWTKNFHLALILTFVGMILLVVSTLPEFLEQKKIIIDNDEIVKMIPNMGIALTGWFLTAFSILHTYPPNILRVKTQEMLMIFSVNKK
jgi:hypothetical protein